MIAQHTVMKTQTCTKLNFLNNEKNHDFFMFFLIREIEKSRVFFVLHDFALTDFALIDFALIDFTLTYFVLTDFALIDFALTDFVFVDFALTEKTHIVHT